MRLESAIALRFLRRNSARTAALALVCGLLSFFVCGGTLCAAGVRQGLRICHSRLGADVTVTRDPASPDSDDAFLSAVRGTEGVMAASPQFLLAEGADGVRIVGFEPETDFTVQPWIQKAWAGEIGNGDVIAGSAVPLPESRTLLLYGASCRVAARLEAAGGGLDRTIFANMNTIRTLIRTAREAGLEDFDGLDPDRLISSVLVRIQPGHSPEEVAGRLTFQRMQAVPAEGPASRLAGKLSGAADAAAAMGAALWPLALAVLAAAFGAAAFGRRQELWVLREAGASRRMLRRLLLSEFTAVSLAGGTAGFAAAFIASFPLSLLLRRQLALPRLLPGILGRLLLLPAVLALCAAAGFFAAWFAAGWMEREERRRNLRRAARAGGGKGESAC